MKLGCRKCWHQDCIYFEDEDQSMLPLSFLEGQAAYPLDLGCLQSSRSDIRDFARAARALGVQYVGLCCGSCSYLLREIAVEYGRHPPALKYAPNLQQSFVLGKDLHGRSAHIWRAMTGKNDPATSDSKKG